MELQCTLKKLVELHIISFLKTEEIEENVFFS